MKILLADDEISALQLLQEEVKEILPDAEMAGFQMPSRAMEYAEQNKIDVAFLDVEMPGMNGLELARKLKRTNANINIIFVTAYDEYGLEAMKLRASGYLQKPVSGKEIKEELEQLRYPVEQKHSGIFVRTFGQFDLFLDGKPVTFHRLKSKEVLAYLTDRKGGSVTKRELASILFEDREYDRTAQDYLNKIVRDLEKTLKEAGAEKMLIRQRNCYAVDPAEFQCDLYDYENGLPEALNAFRGEYMKQYTWGEDTLGTLY